MDFSKFAGLTIGYIEKIKHLTVSYPNIKAIATIIIFIILARAISHIIKNYLLKLVRQTANTLDDELVMKTEYPFIILIVLIGLNISSEIINLPNAVILTIHSIIMILSAYIISTMLKIFTKFWEEEWSIKTNIKIDNIMFSVIDRVIYFSIMSIAILLVLKKWNVNLGPIITSLGIAGLVVGFGLKDTFSNMFDGLFLIMDRVYNYNDTVKLSTGELGNVLEVGFRSTRIRTYDNEILIVPNSQVATSIIKNYSQPNNRIRTNLTFTIEYGTNPETIKETILKSLKKVPAILQDPEPIVYFEEMGENGMKFRLYYWVGNYRDKFMSLDSANINIYNAFKNSKIKLAYPTRTTYTKKERKM